MSNEARQPHGLPGVVTEPGAGVIDPKYASAEWFEKHGIPDPQKAPKAAPRRVYG